MGKIALLFSGHLRSLDVAIKDWKRKHPEFYDPSITDVFCHTWSGPNRTAWENANKDRILSGDVFSIEDLKKSMNVVSYCIEDYDSSPVADITKNNSYIGANFSIAYGTKRVYELFREYADRTDTDYDIVIKTRVDTFLGKFPKNVHGDWYEQDEIPDPLPLEYLKSKITESENRVMIPWFDGCDHGGLTDQILIGSKKSMKVVCCSYFEWLTQNANSIVNWHIETNHKRFADDYQLDIQRFDYQWGIIRTGAGFDKAKINWLGFSKL